MKVIDDAIKWEKYLKYLKDFSEKYKDPIWMGLSPYTYDEWLNYHKKGEI